MNGIIGKRRKGATSVLIIFMMIVLVTLGAFAIVFAHSNIKLSQKAISWEESYYGLDSLANEFLKDFDSGLARAEEYADSIIFTKAFFKDAGFEAAADKSGYLNEKFNEIYIEKAIEFLNEFASERDCEVYYDGIEKTFEFVHGTQEMYLNVYLGIRPLTFELEAGTLTFRRNPESRYSIYSWNQWQSQPEIHEKMEFWDGVIE